MRLAEVARLINVAGVVSNHCLDCYFRKHMIQWIMARLNSATRLTARHVLLDRVVDFQRGAFRLAFRDTRGLRNCDKIKRRITYNAR